MSKKHRKTNIYILYEQKMKENWIFGRLPAKFCGMVEEYRLELAKKSGIDLQLDVSLAGCSICGIHEVVLISKSFGFIKWLFDNKKIDLEELETELSGIGIHRNIGYYEGLLMLLSIQDNPIEFLVSILK